MKKNAKQSQRAHVTLITQSEREENFQYITRTKRGKRVKVKSRGLGFAPADWSNKQRMYSDWVVHIAQFFGTNNRATRIKHKQCGITSTFNSRLKNKTK